jgi:hypothetical protein
MEVRMANDGLGPIDLTGRWVGFYRHRSEHLGAFPLTAEVRQEGNRITGEMYDQIKDRSQLLDTIVEVHREEISPRKMLRLEEVIRRFGDGAVLVNSHLPEASDIEGTVVGDVVSFTKSYRGAFEVHWNVKGKQVGSATRPRHKVQYSGVLDRERGWIGGEWVIPRRGLLGRFFQPETRGTFELYRKA